VSTEWIGIILTTLGGIMSLTAAYHKLLGKLTALTDKQNRDEIRLSKQSNEHYTALVEGIKEVRNGNAITLQAVNDLAVEVAKSIKAP
jgi:hypothetical protein